MASYIEKEKLEGRLVTREEVSSNYDILDPMCLEAALSDLVNDIECPVDLNDELVLDDQQLVVFDKVSRWIPANPNKHFIVDESWEARQKRVTKDRLANTNNRVASRGSSSQIVAATKRSRGGGQQTPVSHRSDRSATSTPRSLASSSSSSSFSSSSDHAKDRN